MKKMKKEKTEGSPSLLSAIAEVTVNSSQAENDQTKSLLEMVSVVPSK